MSQPSPSRLPSLDGLRALAILIVIASHLGPQVGFRWSPSALATFDVGRYGVKIFFVISGFLISSLLFAELERNGRISLPRFYARRALRIFPAFYVFLAVLGALAVTGHLTIPTRDFIAAATYTSNYVDMQWILTHTWSLAVEEQFYLLWPAAIVLLGRRGGLAVAAASLVVAPIMRVVAPSLYRLDTVGDALAIGCLLAGLRSSIARRDPIRSPRAATVAILGCFIAGLGIEMLHSRPSVAPPHLYSLVYLSCQNVFIAGLVYWSVTWPESIAGRWLNTKTAAFIGIASYSLYLWQQPMINSLVDSPLTRLPWNVFLIAGCATASYLLVERPLLGLRRRLAA